jgi:F-type H+-transporting ATPase subunit a
MGNIIETSFSFMDWSVNLKHSLLIMILMGVFSWVVGQRFKTLKTTDKPGIFLGLVIMAISTLNGFIKSYYGVKWKKYAPLLFTILFYLMIANTANLWGLATPLSNINIALAFSLFAIIVIQGAGLVVKKPWQRIKDLSSPNPILFPINLFGELATPTAMGLRLFGNILSGAVISALFYAFFGPGVIGNLLSVTITTALLHPIFTVFFGAIQAFVYFMLLTIFLSMVIDQSDATSQQT